MNKVAFLPLIALSAALVLPVYAKEDTVNIDVLFPEVIKSINDFSAILDKVESQKSLDNQEKALTDLQQRLLKLIQLTKKLPNLSEKIKFNNSKKYQPVMQRVFLPLLLNIERLHQNKVSSDALKKTLDTMGLLHKELTPRVQPSVSPTLEEMGVTEGDINYLPDDENTKEGIPKKDASDEIK